MGCPQLQISMRKFCCYSQSAHTQYLTDCEQGNRLQIFYSGAAFELFGLGALALLIAVIFPTPESENTIRYVLTPYSSAQVCAFKILSM
jgi:hypothetical protein